MITTATAKPPERQKDGHTLYVWALTPGTAYKIDDDRREHTEVTITKAQAAGASYTYILRFIHGRTVAVFSLSGEEYAQPLPTGPAPTPPRRARRAERARPAARRATPPRDGSPAPAARGDPAPAARPRLPKRVQKAKRVRLADLDL